LTELF